MPSQITHLAVAKKYLEKHPGQIKNLQQFLDGNVVPDLATNKAESHCGIRVETHDILKWNREKVNPNKFIETHDMSNDFNKGQYLHLYVDYCYYNDFLLWYFKKQQNGNQINADMYETTRRDEVYLQNKYGVNYGNTTLVRELELLNAGWDEEYVVKRQQIGYKFFIPYDFGALDNFIEKMASIEIPAE